MSDQKSGVMPNVGAGVPPMVQGPRCSVPDCGAPPIAQWSRRPTDAELAVLITTVEERLDSAFALADQQQQQQQQQPTFGPLPSAEDTVIAMFGCGEHAIHRDHAARIHASDCSAPHPDHLPGCDCEPEPLPPREWMITSPGAMTTLPTGWTIPAPWPPATDRTLA